MNEMGEKVETVPSMGGVGPAWTRGEAEKPAGEKDMGGWTAAVYTAEQQARLGVNEMGDKVDEVVADQDQEGSKPEVPADVAGVGPQISEETTPHKVTQGKVIGGMGGMGPAWTRGETEQPAGTKNMGTWTAAVYTAEQQARLGVNEMGVKLGEVPEVPKDVAGVLSEETTQEAEPAETEEEEQDVDNKDVKHENSLAAYWTPERMAAAKPKPFPTPKQDNKDDGAAENSQVVVEEIAEALKARVALMARAKLEAAKAEVFLLCCMSMSFECHGS